MAGIIKVNQYQDFNGNTILTSDGSGNLTTQKTNYPAFEAHLSSDQSVSDNTTTKVQFDTEIYDTNNMYDNSTNYRFLPTVAGKYYVYGFVRFSNSSSNTFANTNAMIYKNGSVYKNVINDPDNNELSQYTAFISATIDFNGSSDYVEIFAAADVTSGTPRFESENKETSFGAYRIGS